MTKPSEASAPKDVHNVTQVEFIKKCRLVANPEYVCPRCTGLSRTIDGRPSILIEQDDTTLDIEPT